MAHQSSFEGSEAGREAQTGGGKEIKRHTSIGAGVDDGGTGCSLLFAAVVSVAVIAFCAAFCAAAAAVNWSSTEAVSSLRLSATASTWPMLAVAELMRPIVRAVMSAATAVTVAVTGLFGPIMVLIISRIADISEAWAVDRVETASETSKLLTSCRRTWFTPVSDNKTSRGRRRGAGKRAREDVLHVHANASAGHG